MIDVRKQKRIDRKWSCGATQEAFDLGCAAAIYPHRLPPRLQRNPYPPGIRYDEWERGYATADPMGEYHGRNL